MYFSKLLNLYIIFIVIVTSCKFHHAQNTYPTQILCPNLNLSRTIALGSKDGVDKQRGHN